MKQIQNNQMKSFHIIPHPFLKWAGGKSQLIESLKPFFPKSFEKYYEPFLGGGAVFFYLITHRPSFNAFLSDSNEELINGYIVVRDNVEELIHLLKSHKKNYSKDPKKYYYFVRDEMQIKGEVERAARLVFLNKTCYNGLYRVNKKGGFNVPFGIYKNPMICDEKNLRNVSLVLNRSNAKLFVMDYTDALKSTFHGDFIYLDPPYQPVSATASFTSYTDKGFTINDQKNLAEVFKQLDQKGCIVLLSNSDTPLIYDLYKDYLKKQVSVIRAISCVGNNRTGHSELIITNEKTEKELAMDSYLSSS